MLLFDVIMILIVHWDSSKIGLRIMFVDVPGGALDQRISGDVIKIHAIHQMITTPSIQFVEETTGGASYSRISHE